MAKRMNAVNSAASVVASIALDGMCRLKSTNECSPNAPRPSVLPSTNAARLLVLAERSLEVRCEYFQLLMMTNINVPSHSPASSRPIKPQSTSRLR